VLNKKNRSFGKWNPIRWIVSKCRIFKAINTNWTAALSHLEQKASDTDETILAKSLLKDLTTVEFIYFLRFICDFTTSLGMFSQVFRVR
jgi:hypothetical protein